MGEVVAMQRIQGCIFFVNKRQPVSPKKTQAKNTVWKYGVFIFCKRLKAHFPQAGIG